VDDLQRARLWAYLVRKLKPLGDNNYTARLIFDRTNEIMDEPDDGRPGWRLQKVS
jgi:hypothetical protein